MKSFDAIAQSAYEAFIATVPENIRAYPWAELPEVTQRGWLAAARKMAEEIQQVH